MASGMVQNQGTVPENLKQKLALAVRSIQWSYGIFWSISASQPGVLEWGEGYYNGDIKTRKTIQSVELNADQMGLQRSEQLRELYESLSAGESSPQIRRPSAALSPEDLSDTEWYYLVCMSFIFDIGQGLPGRTLATGQPIWLCNAHYADSKVFSRSLLAKSASMQTVVCFPFRGGVVELGVAEMIKEDPSLIRHVKKSFLEVPYPKASRNSNAASRHRASDEHLACNALDNEISEIKMISLVGEPEMTSPDTSSSDFEPNHLPEDSFMVEGINGVASQVQSMQFMDEEFSNCIPHSVNSSDCISQTFVEQGKFVGTEKEKVSNVCHQQSFQECDQAKLIENGSEDLHYQNVLSFLLKSSHPLVLGPHFQRGKQESSFVTWKKGGFSSCHMPPSRTPQKLLKRILFDVPRMHESGFASPVDNSKKDEVWRPEADDIGANHMLSERRRRGKINKRFSLLKSIIPCINKVDKVSILDETIEYLRGLERKVAELESHRESLQQDVKSKRKFQDIVERTSDNYNDNPVAPSRRTLNKRKVCDIDGTEDEINHAVEQRNGSIENLFVSMDENNVLIEMKCSWRDGVLLEIINVLSNLHLDCYSVKSSTSNGILSLKIKSKFRGLTISSGPTIKEELQRLVRGL